MPGQNYRRTLNTAEMAQAEQAIRKAGLISFVALGLAIPVAYFLLPVWIAFPDALADRLAFAARSGVWVLFCVVVGVGMVSTARRRSPEDIGGSAGGPPSEKIAISVAFLQNTLEQAVLAVGLYLALATLVSGPWLSLIPVGVVFFLLGRVLFYRGYPQGAEGRALGMSLTTTPTALGYVLVMVLMVMRWF